MVGKKVARKKVSSKVDNLNSSKKSKTKVNDYESVLKAFERKSDGDGGISLNSNSRFVNQSYIYFFVIKRKISIQMQ